jgi:hypothetical protein
MAVDAGLLTQHASEEALATATGAGQDHILVLRYPPTITQPHQEVLVQVPFQRLGAAAGQDLRD